jgi:hypothetical protein
MFIVVFHCHCTDIIVHRDRTWFIFGHPKTKQNKFRGVLVWNQTIPAGWPPLFDEVVANFCE